MTTCCITAAWRSAEPEEILCSTSCNQVRRVVGIREHPRPSKKRYKPALKLELRREPNQSQQQVSRLLGGYCGKDCMDCRSL